jgi:adsorption protein B
MRSAFFGVLFPPVFPIRLIYGNTINFVATVRAFKLKLFGDKATNERINKGHKEKAKKEVKWSKTDHEFLSRDQLRMYRRMLGDTLIVQGYLTAKEFNEALEKVDKEHGQQIGAYLIEKGVITEEQMITALGHVKHVQFIPDGVARKLDFEDALKRFDRDMLRRLRLMPLTFEGDKCIVAICNETKDEDLETFKTENNLQVVRMYVMETIIDEALGKEPSAPDDDSAPDKITPDKKELLAGLEAYHKGELLYEQVVLIGMYAELLSKTESEIRQYMGL